MSRYLKYNIYNYSSIYFNFIYYLNIDFPCNYFKLLDMKII